MTEEQQALADRCTKLQRATVIGIVSGKSQRQAYYDAGGTAKTDASADACVSAMLSNPKAKAFYDALMASAASEAVMTRQQAIELLTSIAVANREEDPKTSIQAVKQLSELQGWNAPQKLEINDKRPPLMKREAILPRADDQDVEPARTH